MTCLPLTNGPAIASGLWQMASCHWTDIASGKTYAFSSPLPEKGSRRERRDRGGRGVRATLPGISQRHPGDNP